MKLRNKKTGEIVEWFNNTNGVFPDSLAELNEEWEDYNELEHYYILHDGEVVRMSELISSDLRKNNIAIGNYFETKKEAEKAVEKLKAWKRLKDKGFRFDGYDVDFEGFWVIYPNDTEGTWCLTEDEEDLNLLFGGEK